VIIRYASYYSTILSALISLEEAVKPLFEKRLSEALDEKVGHDQALFDLVSLQLDHIQNESTELKLKRTVDRVRRIRSYLQRVGLNIRQDKQTMHEIKTLREALEDDLSEYRIFIPSLEQAEYHYRPKLFGLKVYDAFPSARQDILEAGNCYATDNFTACVFHLMRVAERGMRVIARHLKIKKINKAPLEYAEWGPICGALKRKIVELQQRARGAKKSALLKRYGDAASQADMINEIWRKEVSHAREPYNQPEALNAMVRVREFMQSIGEWLRESNREK
jgi:hypothetical protein